MKRKPFDGSGTGDGKNKSLGNSLCYLPDELTTSVSHKGDSVRGVIIVVRSILSDLVSRNLIE
jgi:hypothetical protein